MPAYDAGEIVRSWPLRGTLHLVAAEDLTWMLELTAERAIASAAGRRAVLGITLSEIERAREIAIQALPAAPPSVGWHCLLRSQQGAYPPQASAATTCSGTSPKPARSSSARRIAAGSALPGSKIGFPVRGGSIARKRWASWPLRYFRSHGPASVEDLARWSGLGLRDVRKGIAVSGASLATLEIDGMTCHRRRRGRRGAGPA